LSDARTTTTTVLDGARVAARPRPTITVMPAERERPRRHIDWATVLVHLALIAAVAVIAFPLYYAFVISTQALDEVIQKPPRLLPSTHLIENYVAAWRTSGMARLLVNSTIVAVGVAVGKISISMLSAFAIVYFRFRGAGLVFWMIFLTLMLPIPVRILPTYEVVGDLGWLNTYAGLTVPLMASATATFLFRQFYLTIPNELAEAAQLDGAGPLRFLWSFLLPLSWANIAALFVVLFIYGWNEYFWPLLITNTEEMRTVVIGLERLIPRSGTELPTWNLIMAGAMMALLPPVAVILFMQRWFVKGLIESEK
jgi:sn-glycerol 3-phosphate transport system permease protein